MMLGWCWLSGGCLVNRPTIARPLPEPNTGSTITIEIARKNVVLRPPFLSLCLPHWCCLGWHCLSSLHRFVFGAWCRGGRADLLQIFDVFIAPRSVHGFRRGEAQLHDERELCAFVIDSGMVALHDGLDG
uniref:Putative secreted protein n=1 Tax=Anopheles darlingi TaxID=43151 RepID=A0A2M4DF83_ANODA